MTLPHGFKADSIRFANEVREEIGLGHRDLLDVRKLAAQWGVEVVSMEDLPCPAESRAHFTESRVGKLSGYLFPTPDGLAVVYNPAHDRFRTRSTVAHEIAHVILEHEFDLLIGDDDGCKFGTGTQEEEANWFAGELLLPQGAARAAVFRGDTYESVSAQFDISIQMARWRMNISGAVQIMKRRSGARR